MHVMCVFVKQQGLDLIYLRWAIGGGDSSGSNWGSMASWWPSLEFLARCEKIKNIQIFICKYETGIFGLRMALEAKSDLRFEI